ncbi:hypothetical protein [Rathayibacter rathayi]|uniref:hypothetical protein n=1 Tax=Rathayibacter rathayi TaxID=33887 RepID=UPI0015E218A5|nr:hypothetical protein [Rathayibacter rathayi]
MDRITVHDALHNNVLGAYGEGIGHGRCPACVVGAEPVPRDRTHEREDPEHGHTEHDPTAPPAAERCSRSASHRASREPEAETCRRIRGT